ncbi:hypothetical protein [Prescottella sp. R16]|uniref:PPE domain-containing protein n=1 Tax=Prescottella sp. R16 TaxID=3064529 RepID=UPI00272E7985|nr:hypothetical protein [Prescottella sp. R16]
MGLPSFSDFVQDLSRDIVEFGKNPQNKVLEMLTGTDYAEERRARAAQAAGNADRDGIYSTQAGLAGGITRFDDPVLTSPEAFEGMSHEAIKAAVDAMNGPALAASAEGWQKIGDTLDQALTEFRDFITGTITDDRWSGVAADRARAATTRYADQSTVLARAGQLVGTKIAEAATGVVQVQATVPPVAQYSPLGAAFSRALPVSGMIKSIFHEQDEAHQQAIQIMRTVYAPVMQQADTNVPALPDPKPVTADPGTGTGTGTGSTGGAPTGTTGYTPYRGSGSGTPTATPPSAMNPESVAPAGAYPGYPGPADTVAARTDPATGWSGSGTSGASDATRTAAAQFGGPANAGQQASAPGGYLAGAGAGSGPRSTGRGGVGGGTSTPGSAPTRGLGSLGSPDGIGSGAPGGLGSSGRPGVSSSIPGVSNATTAGTASATGTAGTRGVPGATGMMPGAGARGRGGDDDNEHKTPDYLVNVDNGSELIGRLPMAAPPVIGS